MMGGKPALEETQASRTFEVCWHIRLLLMSVGLQVWKLTSAQGFRALAYTL